jgi:hypothetical protein
MTIGINLLTQAKAVNTPIGKFNNGVYGLVMKSEKSFSS